MQKAYYDILGARHFLYSNLQINKVSSASHYLKYQLNLITYKILMLGSSRVEERVQTAGVIHTFRQSQ